MLKEHSMQLIAAYTANYEKVKCDVVLINC